MVKSSDFEKSVKEYAINSKLNYGSQIISNSKGGSWYTGTYADLTKLFNGNIDIQDYVLCPLDRTKVNYNMWMKFDFDKPRLISYINIFVRLYNDCSYDNNVDYELIDDNGMTIQKLTINSDLTTASIGGNGVGLVRVDFSTPSYAKSIKINFSKNNVSQCIAPVELEIYERSIVKTNPLLMTGLHATFNKPYSLILSTSNPQEIKGNIGVVSIKTQNTNSGATGYMSQNNIHYPPIYSTSSNFGNNNCYKFSTGSKNGVRLQNLPMATNGFTIMMPMYISASTPNFSSPFRFSLSDGSKESEMGFTSVSSTYSKWGVMGSADQTNNCWTSVDGKGVFGIMTIVFTPTTTTQYFNKKLIKSVSLSRSVFTSLTTLFIGFGRWNNQFLTGEIGATYLVYDTLTNSEVISQVEEYETYYSMNLDY